MARASKIALPKVCSFQLFNTCFNKEIITNLNKKTFYKDIYSRSLVFFPYTLVLR
ncbi:uncharacterized protein RNJ42_02912 [Nakaseomyces bracarensis]|uniref:uncharacterized protein n=1 Tax=Nakaseomyces bracarensis TaxID=273131 RepID=UPI003871FEF5